MKKLTLWLLLTGSLLMSFTLLTRSFLNISEYAEYLMKGFGVALVVGALILEKSVRKQIGSDTLEE